MKRILALLVVCLTFATPANAAIAYVNGAAGRDMTGSSGTTIATSAFAACSGCHIALGIRWDDATATISSIADTAGNSYQEVPVCSALADIGGTVHLRFYFVENATANASNVATVTFSGAVPFRSVVAIQHSGVATSSSWDACSLDTVDSTPTCTTGSFSTASTNEVIITVSQQTTVSANWSAGGGATFRFGDGSGGTGATNAVVGIQSEIVSTIQSGVIATATSSGSGDDCSNIVATFRAAAVASGRRNMLLFLP